MFFQFLHHARCKNSTYQQFDILFAILFFHMHIYIQLQYKM